MDQLPMLSVETLFGRVFSHHQVWKLFDLVRVLAFHKSITIVSYLNYTSHAACSFLKTSKFSRAIFARMVA